MGIYYSGSVTHHKTQAVNVPSSKHTIENPGNKEALALWYKVTLESVRDAASYDLSVRQMALLLTVYTAPGPHTVRGLSTHLQISKPAICRALDTLSKYQLVERQVDENDRRNIFIVPTESGYHFLGRFSDNVMNVLMEL